MDDSSTGPNEPSGGAADASDTADLARRQRRVFCNRSLRLDQVEWVGFDMDYTLAIYNQAEMDRAAVRSTLGRLVGSGYPADLAELVCPLDFPVRGLLVDIERGNVLKMDRYRYVKVAHHGLTLLSRDERRALYEQRPQPGATGFQWVDTLYSLADVTVYCAVIDALDRAGVVTEYAQLWRDVRRCADDVHRSGEIYALIEAEFERFVQPDPMLAPLLHRLRSSGKKLFLLTNSQPESTEMVMSRLLDGARRDYPSWRNYFDVMITDAAKPTFFVGRRPFEDVAAATGAPGVSGTPGASGVAGRPDAAEALRRDVLYRGGNLAAFERLIGAHGPQVLYVGDHIYGDVLRANVESGWRTVMIIQEMEEELVALDAHRSHFDEIDALDREARALADDLRDLRDEVAAAGARARRLDRLNDRLVERLRRLQSERDRLEVEVDAAFHRCWGSIFSAGSELSRFGSQVERYAWLYTSRASNLGGYSPGHFFRSPRSRLAHEL